MGVRYYRTHSRNKKIDVELIWEPPWGMDMMSDEAKLELGFI